MMTAVAGERSNSYLIKPTKAFAKATVAGSTEQQNLFFASSILNKSSQTLNSLSQNCFQFKFIYYQEIILSIGDIFSTDAIFLMPSRVFTRLRTVTIQLVGIMMVMESVPLYFSRFHQLLGSLSCSLTIEISSEVLSPWRSSLIRREASVEASQQPKSLRQLHSLSLAFASLIGHPET